MSLVELLPLLAQVLVKASVMNSCNVADNLKVKLKLCKVGWKEKEYGRYMDQM